MRRDFADQVNQRTRLSVDGLGACADLRLTEQVSRLTLLLGQYNSHDVPC